ncbi:MAG TPA: methyltransferase domain-containing protein [Vicinamibacterales bacterium]|jgi:SAM-dependent methyltransferase|nr:methyltransferase domain-containing protein [Vicinamibacterales bacterium]
MDPLAGSPWSDPSTVAGFSKSLPNDTLIAFAKQELRSGARALDIGCGAGRNAVPLAEMGWEVAAVDLSWPMLEAAIARARHAHVDARLHPVLAPMEHLPIAGASIDFVIAHGIWNLARSSAEFRRGVAEAARVTKPGAALFVFTFSRHTLPPDATPIEGESFVFTQFSGNPQCFLTEAQLVDELRAAGFEPDAGVPLTEHNRPQPGAVPTGAPVLYEAAFRRSKG